MNQKRKLFTKLFYSVVLTLSITACSDEEIFKQEHGNNLISFSIDDAAIEPMTSRSASDEAIYPSYGMSVNQKDSLYFHTDVSDYQTLSDYVETRGVIINNDNVDKNVSSIMIDAFVNDNLPYIIKYPISKQNNGVWSGPDNRYWPSNKKEELDFYASAMTPENLILSYVNGQTKTSKYTVPHSSNMTDAEVQPDIMFGYARCSREEAETKHEGNVPLQMRHALAAISFNVGDFRKGKIKTITIRNARKSGTLTYSENLIENTSNPKFDWTLDDELTNFTQTFDIDVKDETPTPITSQKPEATFMLLPQDIEKDNVQFEVELEVDNNGVKETITLVAPAIKAGDIQGWEAGKHYIYTLSSTSINWTYVFGIDSEVLQFEEGEQRGNRTVTSYRYRTGNPSKTEPVEWNVIPEKAIDKGFSQERIPDEWIEQYLESGIGSVTGEIWNLIVSPNRLLGTDYGGDTTLKEKPSRGSTDEPWDLSTNKLNGEAMGKTTANCYVVNSAGTYCFPAVYGNSYKNGNKNIDNKHTNITGSEPEIKGIKDATILWVDGLGLISDVKYDSENKMVVFSIDKDHIQQGNATIGVRNGEGEILWSWHIWVYEKDIYSTYTSIDDFYDSSIKYKLMDNNLGFCAAKTVSYARREGTISFVQEISGKSVELNVILKEFDVTTQDNNSATYQWGRKDPFMGVTNISKLAENKESRKYKPCFPKGGEYLVSDATKDIGSGSIYIKESIKQPNKIWNGSISGISNSWMADKDKNAWNQNDGDGQNLVKTVFDPCPVGFKIPPYKAFRIFSKDGNNHPTQQESDYLINLKNTNLDQYNIESLQMFEKWLNGNPAKLMLDYQFNTQKDSNISGTNPGIKIEMLSTGRRPLSGTEGNFNNLILWTGDVSSKEHYAFVLKVGYDSNNRVEPYFEFVQAGICPVRPILDE